jgi:molybdopterin molybdotransferase
MTGAVVPAGANCIIMQEEAQRNEDTVEILKSGSEGQFIRKAGSDITAGDIVIQQGQRLGAAELGLLASLGLDQICVYEKAKIALMSTGDELKLAGETLADGEIYESNSAMLCALLAAWPVEVIDLGIIPDDKDATRQAFDSAISQADLLISSGGVSVGEADFVREILDEKGKIGFWRLAIKPGKPLAFGNIESSLFLGLPGNPVSSMVTFIQVAQPLLRILCGEHAKKPLQLQATLQNSIKKRPGRRDFQRGVVSNNGEKLLVATTGNQQSNVLTSMAKANCFIVLDEQQGDVAAGETVTIQLFSDLF